MTLFLNRCILRLDFKSQKIYMSEIIDAETTDVYKHTDHSKLNSNTSRALNSMRP